MTLQRWPQGTSWELQGTSGTNLSRVLLRSAKGFWKMSMNNVHVFLSICSRSQFEYFCSTSNKCDWTLRSTNRCPWTGEEWSQPTLSDLAEEQHVISVNNMLRLYLFLWCFWTLCKKRESDFVKKHSIYIETPQPAG